MHKSTIIHNQASATVVADHGRYEINRGTIEEPGGPYGAAYIGSGGSYACKGEWKTLSGAVRAMEKRARTTDNDSPYPSQTPPMRIEARRS